MLVLLVWLFLALSTYALPSFSGFLSRAHINRLNAAGGAENAGVEKAGVEKSGADRRAGKCRSGKIGRKSQGWKMQEWKSRERFGRSRSSKVDEFVANRKRICDFLY